MKLNEFKLLNSGSPISNLDIKNLESYLGLKFPAEFRELYLASNGGSPNREFWNKDEGFEPIRVEDFKSIAHAGASDENDTKYIGGCFKIMRERNVLPAQLIPFASDEAGNFICLENGSGRIIYFAVDIFQSDVDMSINHVNAQKFLSASFDEFVRSLIDEDEVDY